METKDHTGHKIVEDKFAKDLRITRYVPGDSYCLDCHEPIAAWWNRGNPKPAEEQLSALLEEVKEDGK